MSFEYVFARSLEHAARLLAEGGPGTVAQAGGVDLQDRLAEGLDAPSRVVSLSRIPREPLIELKGGTLRISALATLSEIAEAEAVRTHFAALAKAAATAANPNVRNAATLGGNLCQRPRCHYFRSELHPCTRKGGKVCFAQRGDNRMHALFDNEVCAAVTASSLAAPLAVLNATVELLSPTGSRAVPCSGFFVKASEDPERETALAPGELISHVSVPVERGLRQAYGKVQHRSSQDWPIAEAAVALRAEGGVIREARIALGAMAMTPMRAAAAEAALVGTSTAEAWESACERVTQGASPMSENRYKLSVIRSLVRELVTQAMGGSTAGGEP
jgi:xanthine dehydrogenase YagS FAD-binding subunit